MKNFIAIFYVLFLPLLIGGCSYVDATHYSPELKSYQRNHDQDYQDCEVKLHGKQSNESFKSTDLPGETTKFHLCRSNNRIVLMEGSVFSGDDPWSKKCLKSNGKIYTKKYGVGFHRNGKFQDTVYANSYVCLVNGMVTSAINN